MGFICILTIREHPNRTFGAVNVATFIAASQAAILITCAGTVSWTMTYTGM